MIPCSCFNDILIFQACAVLHNYLIHEATTDIDILEESLETQTRDPPANEAEVNSGTAAGIRKREDFMALLISFRDS